MERTELLEIMKLLRQRYPDGNFVIEDWYAMYKKYPAEILREGVEECKLKKPPTPSEFREVYVGPFTVGGWDPDGMTMKALERIKSKTQVSYEDILEEMRY